MAAVWKTLSMQCKCMHQHSRLARDRLRLAQRAQLRQLIFTSSFFRTFCTSTLQKSTVDHASAPRTLSDRELFEIKLVDLLSGGYEEQELTDRRLPDSILHELTKDFERPKLARISKQELYRALQANASALMPYANMLNHWAVDDDDKLQQSLRELHSDVNYVRYEDSTHDKTDEAHDDDLQLAMLSDDDLLQLMQEQYASDFDTNNSEDAIETLYRTAMLFYDLSNKSLTSAMDVNNRLSSILLTLTASFGTHVEAQKQLGKQYLLGYGVPCDYASAIYYFVRSAAMGSIESRTYLGVMYMFGFGVRRNIARAHALLNECSRAMNPIAQRYLAQLYENGYDEVNDDEEDDFELAKDHYIALRLAEKACNYGAHKLQSMDDGARRMCDDKFIVEAATIAGRMYCVHLNDFKSGVKYFEIAVDAGQDTDAQCNLGHIYWIGVASQVEPDIYKAVSYLLSAANKGHRRAHRELGMIYAYSGLGGQHKDIENLKEATLWLDLAGKEGYIDCYVRLAEIYAAGNNKYAGIAQNFKVSGKYLQYARDESDLSKNFRDKLPENIWSAVMQNPLHCVSLIESYEKLIGAKWTGQFINDLDPANHQKMAGV